jgi:hypothetical protein
MSVRGNAAPRGMTAHDRIRLTGPFADFFSHDSPGWEGSRPGLTTFERRPGLICIVPLSCCRVGDHPTLTNVSPVKDAVIG